MYIFKKPNPIETIAVIASDNRAIFAFFSLIQEQDLSKEELTILGFLKTCLDKQRFLCTVNRVISVYEFALSLKDTASKSGTCAVL